MFYMVTNKFEVSIDDHGGGIAAKIDNKLREGKGNGMVLHVLEGIYIFVTGFAVY